MTAVLALLILAAIVIGIIAVVRRIMDKREATPEGAGDVIAYLLLALAVGVTAFSLASLASTAFPGEGLVVDAGDRVADALAGIVVAAPVAVFLWRRQAERRAAQPASPGWTVYLSVIEAVFTTALVVALFGLLDRVLGDGTGRGWTDVVVFGAVIGFHEWASARTPPASDAAELPRVIGSAIGLVPLVVGLGGIITWLLAEVYATLAPGAGGSGIGSSASLVLAGGPVWAYRWLRPWPADPAGPRKAWTVVVAVAALATAIGSATLVVAQTLIYLLTTTPPAGSHFEFLPVTLSVLVVGAATWAHHRGLLGRERTDPVRAYEYSLTALGLVTAVGAATTLSTAALGPDDLIGAQADLVIATIVTLAAGASVWGLFWRRASALPREVEAASGPRRFYLVGLAIVLGLVAATALIGMLVVLFQALLGSGGGESLAVQASLVVFAGLATWHLVRTRSEDRDLAGSEEALAPFHVTIVCSHPGMVSGRLPSAAKVRVLYRGDDAGVIDDEMADSIVGAVGTTSSIVWVDSDGFRVAPAR